MENNLIARPSDAEIKKSIKLLSLSNIIHILFVLSAALFLRLSQLTGYELFRDIINQTIVLTDFSNYYVALRFIVLLILVFTSIKQLFYILIISFKSNLYITDTNPYKSKYVAYSLKLSKDLFFRIIIFITYIILVWKSDVTVRDPNTRIWMIGFLVMIIITHCLKKPFKYVDKYISSLLITHMSEESKESDKLDKIINSDAAISELEIDNLDKLLKYKEMFDKGILTQEEYENKKNEILNNTNQ